MRNNLLNQIKKPPKVQKDLSASSSGNLEMDFMPMQAFAQATDIGNKYSDFKRFYSGG